MRPNTTRARRSTINLPKPCFSYSYRSRIRGVTLTTVILIGIILPASRFFTLLPFTVVEADNTVQSLPFSQDWSNTGLITANDSWAGVAGIEGFLGDRAASGTTSDIDPQTVLDPLTTVDVIANQTGTTIANGGVAEFHTTSQVGPDGSNSTIGLQGSGTADHPNIILYLNTIGQSNINISYNLRDIDCTSDNAVQQIALQFRVGSSGNFTNLPSGYVADATTGPSLCTLVIPISVFLPAAAEDQPEVQVRIISSNAAGSDEWVGIDDIVVTTSVPPTPTPTPTPTPSPSPTPSPGPVADNVIINELDSDTPSTDVSEFIELYDGGAGNTSLNGMVVVFYNGNGDVSYRAIDLDGFTTNGAGYFTLGNSAVPGADLIFPNNSLQNGEDAIALYAGNDTDFPNGTPITTTNLIDAVVYDTSDPDDVGLLVLLNAGQPQVDENANSNGATVSIGRCPNGEGGKRNTTTYLARIPTPDAVNDCPAPPVAAAIHDIQGNGLASPLVGQTIITSGIVTARKSNGFFLQEPDASVDVDPTTSEGIFVFTGAAPLVSAGDAITVNPGVVTEFFNLTEISTSNSNITVTSSGNSLPAPIVLTTSILNPNGTVTQLEPYEGMRLHGDSLTTVSPTNGFAESFTVLTGVARPFREPGIEASFTLPSGTPCCVPRFDENPERIMVDTDGQAGVSALALTSGVVLMNVTGPLDFTFGDYKIIPDAAPGVTPNLTSGPVRLPTSEEFTIASFNMERFLTATDVTNRLNKISLAIRNVMRSPDIIGVEEVGDLTLLQTIADKLNADTVAGGGINPGYAAYLEEGNDIGGIDVGFLAKSSTVTVNSVTQVGKLATFIDPTDTSVDILNDRPPLFLRATVKPTDGAPFPVTVIVNHLRSLIDVSDTGPTGARVRAKRRAQAEFIANEIQMIQATENVVSIGDYNAFQFSDGYVDVMGTIRGVPAAADNVVLASNDLVTPDLVDLLGTLPASEQYSFVFLGSAQVIDHVLLDPEMLARSSGFAYARNNADFPEAFRLDSSRPERVSDHDMPVAYFSSPKAATTTTVSNVTAIFSSSDQSLTLTANVSSTATVNEGSVTFTVTDGTNTTVGVPVTGNVTNGVATASYTLAGGTLPQVLTITGVFSGGDFTHPSTGVGTLNVTYGICLLYDPSRAVRSGATYPIRVQICELNGTNVSASDISLHAESVELVSTSEASDVMDAGNANPDNNFRFDALLGGTGGYVFNLGTSGLASGVYKLVFSVEGDPLPHEVQFIVK